MRVGCVAVPLFLAGLLGVTLAVTVDDGATVDEPAGDRLAASAVVDAPPPETAVESSREDAES